MPGFFLGGAKRSSQPSTVSVHLRWNGAPDSVQFPRIRGSRIADRRLQEEIRGVGMGLRVGAAVHRDEEVQQADAEDDDLWRLLLLLGLKKTGKFRGTLRR